MRPTIAMLIVLLTPLATRAESSITAHLHLAGDIAVRHHAEARGGCKGGRHVYLDQTRNYSAPLDLHTTGEASASAFIRHEPHDSARYEVRVDAATKTTNDYTFFRVTVKESTIKHGEYHWGSGCEHNHLNEDLQSGGYEGQIVLKYKVPDGVWAVLLNKGPANAVFTNAAESPFSNVLMRALEGDEEIIWVKPGSVLEKTFKINADANAARPSATFHLGVSVVAAQPSEDHAKILLNANEFTNAINALNGEKRLEPRKKEAGLFVGYALSLLRSRTVTTAALRKLSFARLQWLTDNLFKLTTATLDVDSPALEMAAKTAAALLSYEVASLTVEEMAPYCEMRYMKSPTNGQRVNVLGARYAQFLLESLGHHLNPNILAAHRAFLTHVGQLQSEKYTYGRAARTDETRRQIAQAYKLLRENAALNQRPFRQAQQDLKEFFLTFPGGQPTGEPPEVLGKKLIYLANQERGYHRLLDAHVHNYRRENTGVIDVSELRTRLDEMTALAADVSASLADQGRFLAIGGDAEANALLKLLIGFRVKNFGVVASAYENVPFKFEFENVRRTYVDPKRLQQNQRTINACVSDGTHL